MSSVSNQKASWACVLTGTQQEVDVSSLWLRFDDGVGWLRVLSVRVAGRCCSVSWQEESRQNRAERALLSPPGRTGPSRHWSASAGVCWQLRQLPTWRDIWFRHVELEARERVHWRDDLWATCGTCEHHNTIETVQRSILDFSLLQGEVKA